MKVVYLLQNVSELLYAGVSRGSVFWVISLAAGRSDYTFLLLNLPCMYVLLTDSTQPFSAQCFKLEALLNERLVKVVMLTVLVR